MVNTKMAMKNENDTLSLELKAEQTQAPSRRQSGSEGEEWLNRVHHPLLNGLILDTLFGHVRRHDLKTCRMVCKQWNVLTIQHMRTSFPVTINGIHSTTDVGRIEHFVHLFNSNVFGIPFAKFKIGPFHARNGVGQKFLQLCGEIALEIDFNRQDLFHYEFEDVVEILRASPNLKFIGFPCNVASRSSNVIKLFPESTTKYTSLRKIILRPGRHNLLLKCCPSGIEELLRAAPYVSDIAANDDVVCDVENGMACDVLNAIEMLGKESSIQSLDFRCVRLDIIHHLLRMKGLKLKNLRLSLFSTEVYGNVLGQLMTSFKDTLRDLKLKFTCFSNTMIEIPTMSQLKSFTLFARDLDLMVTSPVNLNRMLPVLETLDLEIPSGGLPEFFAHSDPCPSMKSLTVRMGMNIQTFQNIPRVFPELTELNLTVREDGGEILREIWTHMTGLDSLDILCWNWNDKLYLDSVFTGIPIHVLKEIRPVLNQLTKMSVRERNEMILKLRDQHSKLPSISDLKKLKHLTLAVRGGVNVRTYLSDLTAYLALYPMDHIRHLDFDDCEFNPTCCELLTKDIELESWSFQNKKYDHIIPPFFL